MPFRSEMDVTPVMEWCWKQGIHVVVPKVVQSTSQMKLYYINNYDDVELGAYGIREPKESNSELTDLSLVDVILVPGVAFDRQGGRLGMGGGYYDRFMDKLLLLENMPSCIALCFQSQVVDHVPSEPHDLRVDVILTEKGILRLQG
jgi:5-formyltetrahydrofolate cyclo-ligase